MSETKTYLPITRSKALRYSEGALSPEERQLLKAHEWAALHTLAKLPKAFSAGKGLPTFCEQVMSLLLESSRYPGDPEHQEDLKNAVRPITTVTQVAQGLLLADQNNIEFLSDEECKQQAFLSNTGRWDKEFRVRKAKENDPFQFEITTPAGHRVTSKESARQYSVFRGNIGEPGAVQGVAGCGKTTSVFYLLETLSPKTAWIVTPRRSQARALSARLAGHGMSEFHVQTFPSIAYRLIQQHAPETALTSFRAKPGYHVAESQIAQALNVQAVDRYSPEQVVRLVRRIVSTWAQSGADQIRPEHIPSQAQVSPANLHVVVELARRYWDALTNPNYHGIHLPVQSRDQIKFCLLHKLRFPAYLRHIIVDEAHELSQAEMDWLDSDPKIATLTLGDQYQNISGFAPRRDKTATRFENTESMRGGKKQEEGVNQLIELHPDQMSQPYKVITQNDFRVCHHGRYDTPPPGTVMLANTILGVLGYLFQMRDRQVDVCVHENSQAALNDLVYGLLDLFHRKGRGQSSYLWRYYTFEQACEAHKRSPIWKKIEREIRNGFSYEQARIFLQKIAHRTPRKVFVAELGSVKNWEFDRVWITNQLLSTNISTSAELAPALSKLYTARTRSRAELWIPGDLDDRLKELTNRIHT